MAAIPDWLLAIPPLLFAAGVGACVGSFLNVVAYRLPRGEGLWSPGSRCPACDTPLGWRENMPVLGWLTLWGRCRFCRSRISAEYPLVEGATALLFAGLYAAWFLWWPTSSGVVSAAAPAWARVGLFQSLPYVLLLLTLMSGLIAMSLIDARTFTIPVSIPWLVTGLALVTHPAHAAWIESTRGALVRGGQHAWLIPTIPVDQPAALAGVLGAGAGLVFALAMLWLGVIPRSFSDYEAWEQAAMSEQSESGHAPVPGGPTIRQVLIRTILLTGPAVALMAAGALAGRSSGMALQGTLAGMVAGLVVGVFLRSWATRREVQASDPDPRPITPTPRRRWVVPAASILVIAAGAGTGWLLTPAHAVIGGAIGMLMVVVGRAAAGAAAGTGHGDHVHAPPGAAGSDVNSGGGQAPGGGVPMWLAYPHARREMLKEIVFLLPVVLAGWAAWRWAPTVWFADPPLWLQAAGGALAGYLVGGAVVWIVRLAGSLAIGKEALGMGDVHLMAAVGAVVGWIDPVLAFFLAPAVGLGGMAIGVVLRRLAGGGAGEPDAAGGAADSGASGGGLGSGGSVVAMPYGPSLALASAWVILFKPWVEELLTVLVHSPVRLP